MMLMRFIYASSAHQINKEDIEQILRASRKNNLSSGVTGMLCYGNNQFLQYLEGDKKNVLDIYERIPRDPRHKSIVMMNDADIDRRIFGDWSMGFVDMNDMLVEITVREVTKTDTFSPSKMDLDTAIRLIKTLKASLSDQIIID